MDSRSRFVVVASLALVLTSVGAQVAPAPGPGMGLGFPGLISGAPGVQNPNPNPLPGANLPTGAASAPGPGGMPMPMNQLPQPTPQVTASPSPTSHSPTNTPSPTSPPVTTLPPATRAASVAFVSRLNLDNPDVFNTQIPTQGNPQGLTYSGLWCYSLVQKYPRATCTAYATPGSVNVQSTLVFQQIANDTSNTAAQEAASLTANLQQIAANPSLANNLIPVAAFGVPTISGIQVTAAAPVGAPAMAPMRAPSGAPAPPESFSFTVRLNFASVAQFDPLRGAWCTQLTRAYPTSTCQVTNVYLGSVYVDTNMTFANGDPSANTMLTQLRDPTANSALFTDPQFGTVTVTSAGGTTVAAASTPPSPPPAKHHLSGGKIAGAVIGSVAGAAILGGCGFAGYKYYHTRRAYQPAV